MVKPKMMQNFDTIFVSGGNQFQPAVDDKRLWDVNELEAPPRQSPRQPAAPGPGTQTAVLDLDHEPVARRVARTLRAPRAAAGDDRELPDDDRPTRERWTC